MMSIKYIWKGIKTLWRRKIEVPVLDATAIGVSVFRGDMGTASSIMFLLGIGELLEEWTHKKSVGDLARTMSLNVGSVWLKREDGQEVQISANEVKMNDRLVIHMGTVIPFDGVVVGGEAMVNQASLTGESVAVRRAEGSSVYAGLPEEYSHLYLAIEGRLAAVICIEDPLRPEACEVIKNLKKAGFQKIVMMTGDSDRTAKAIAAKVGVDEYHSEVLPEDKASFVEKEKAKGRKVIMIGDGINDSPALSAADVGIAIGDGAEIAREIADITIGADDLEEIVILRKISDALMKRIHGNYRFIVGFNAGLIALGVAGVILPTTSALLHNTSTLAIGLKSMGNLTI